jgi:hypothetical protein
MFRPTHPLLRGPQCFVSRSSLADTARPHILSSANTVSEVCPLTAVVREDVVRMDVARWLSLGKSARRHNWCPWPSPSRFVEREAFHCCGTTDIPPTYDSHGHHHRRNMVFSLSSNGSHHPRIITQREYPRTNRTPTTVTFSSFLPTSH